MQVYPEGSTTIHVREPLGEVAQAVRAKEITIRKRQGESIDETKIDQIAMNHCVQLVRTLLSQANIVFSGPNAISQLCIRQRHLHKKGIMFSTYIFSLVIADMLGIEFLWSSDSDTIVAEDSLSRTVDSIAADPTIGGASSALVVHNGQETPVTKLAETVYWGELYLTRSMPAATATSDCQSGPSTLFRLAALPAILVPWYLQTIFGKRMVSRDGLPHTQTSRADTPRSSTRTAISRPTSSVAAGAWSSHPTSSPRPTRPPPSPAGSASKSAGRAPRTSSPSSNRASTP